VTRTIPVSGRFSPEQRQVYEIVLAAQKAAEAQARPGADLMTLSRTAAVTVAGGLARLGLIESPEAVYDCRFGEQVSQCPQYFLFYMHGLGHGIGLDVHDPEPAYPDYGGRFVVGSAFTIEPGIYVRADVLDYLPDTPRNRELIAKVRPAVQMYRNIGVRIEDDYFITQGGVERVSDGAPREIAEIEALMAREGGWNRDRRPRRGGVVPRHPAPLIRPAAARGAGASFPGSPEAAMTRSPAVPFKHRRSKSVMAADWSRMVTRVAGLAWLEDDDLVLQYRVSETVTSGATSNLPVTTESEVGEHRVPLAALRSARVAGGWWWPRIVLAAADLRAFDGFPVPRGAGEELSLRISLAHRSDAADLASTLELALANRLYLPAV